MKLIFIRHAEPDYQTDSLTEKGAREAALLGERTKDWTISQVYCSPMGRAQKTAGPTLAAHGITLSHTYPQAPDDVLCAPDPKTAQVCPWLREFAVGVNPEDHPAKKFIAWDFTPGWMQEHPELYDRLHWTEASIFNKPLSPRGMPRSVAADPEFMELYKKLYGPHYEVKTDVPQVLQEYRWVTGRLDEVLAQWGYVRDGMIYRTNPPAAEPSDAWMTHAAQTVADIEAHREDEPVLLFFCHLGIMDVLISHLIHVSPAVLHHGFFCAPSSVTVLSSEERVPGEANFRIQVMGDTSHLRAGGELVSYYGGFAAPFQQ